MTYTSKVKWLAFVILTLLFVVHVMILGLDGALFVFVVAFAVVGLLLLLLYGLYRYRIGRKP